LLSVKLKDKEESKVSKGNLDMDTTYR